MILYGLSNCDSTKAAMKWLKQNNIIFSFYDYKVHSIDEPKLGEWLKQIPLERLLNKKSTTWRSLPSEEQAKVASEAGAIQLMKENTTLIKRPALEKKGILISVGFDEHEYAKNLIQ